MNTVSDGSGYGYQVGVYVFGTSSGGLSYRFVTAHNPNFYFEDYESAAKLCHFLNGGSSGGDLPVSVH
jgi:hypothetical protein